MRTDKVGETQRWEEWGSTDPFLPAVFFLLITAWSWVPRSCLFFHIKFFGLQLGRVGGQGQEHTHTWSFKAVIDANTSSIPEFSWA